MPDEELAQILPTPPPGLHKSICKICGMGFDSPQLLSAHKRMVHPDGPHQGHGKGKHAYQSKGPPFRCQQCHKKFDKPQQLAAHVQWDHPTGKRLAQRTHVQKRAGKLPFSCDKCGESFNNPQALGAHKRYKHGAGLRKKALPKSAFQCPECGNVFKFARGLGKHRSAVHGVPGASSSAVWLKKKQAKAASSLHCPECGKGPFATPAALGSHRLITHQIAGTSAGAITRQRSVNGNSAGATHDGESFDQKSFNFGHLCAQIQALIAHHAQRDQVSEEILTTRLVGFLAPQTLRKRPGRIGGV